MTDELYNFDNSDLDDLLKETAFIGNTNNAKSTSINSQIKFTSIEKRIIYKLTNDIKFRKLLNLNDFSVLIKEILSYFSFKADIALLDKEEKNKYDQLFEHVMLKITEFEKLLEEGFDVIIDNNYGNVSDSDQSIYCSTKCLFKSILLYFKAIENISKQILNIINEFKKKLSYKYIMEKTLDDEYFFLQILYYLTSAVILRRFKNEENKNDDVFTVLLLSIETELKNKIKKLYDKDTVNHCLYKQIIQILQNYKPYREVLEDVKFTSQYNEEITIIPKDTTDKIESKGGNTKNKNNFINNCHKPKFLFPQYSCKKKKLKYGKKASKKKKHFL